MNISGASGRSYGPKSYNRGKKVDDPMRGSYDYTKHYNSKDCL